MNPPSLSTETDDLKGLYEITTPEIKVPLTDFIVNFNTTNKLERENTIKTPHISQNISERIKKRKSKKDEASRQALIISSFHEPQSANISTRFKNTLWWLISTFYITKKFIGNLRNSTIYRVPKSLKPYHFSLINDKSFFYDDWQARFSASRFWVCLIKFLLKLTAFHPNHLFKICFDLIMMVLTCFLFLAIPICVGFNLDLNFFPEVKIVVIILFFLEILVNFNTAFLEKGELIIDRIRIFKNYIKNQFFYDFLSFLTLIYWLSNIVLEGKFSTLNHLLPMTFFLRVYNISNLIARYEDSVFLVESSSNKISFLKLISFVFLFAHASACMWHYLGSSNEDLGRSWIAQAGILDESWWIRYIYSLYYVVVVMNTIGFGDIVPITHFEKIFSIFFIYFGCSVFAYIINSIGIILQNINKNTREYKRKMYLINGFMKSKNIDFKTRSKVRNYLDYIYQEERNTNYEEVNQIIGKLSKDLKHELTKASNYEVLQNIPFFSKNFSDHSLQKISLELKELNFTPGDIIFQNYDLSKPAIYIIRRGTVELFINNDATDEPLAVLNILGKGQIFGQEMVVTGQNPNFSARSASFTTVFVLPQENLLQIFKKNDYDLETWCQIKDEIINNNNREKLYTQCASCHSDLHITRECPLINVVWIKQNIIARFNFSSFQERREIIRRSREKSSHARKNIDYNLEKVEEIQAKFDLSSSKKRLSLSFEDFSGPAETFSIDSINESSMEKIDKEKFEREKERKVSTKEAIQIPNKKEASNNGSSIHLISSADNFDSMKDYCFYFNKDNAWEFIEKYTKIQNLKEKEIRKFNNIRGSHQRQRKNAGSPKILNRMAQSSNSLRKMKMSQANTIGKQLSSTSSTRRIKGNKLIEI